jgi:O-antigen ligase
MIFLLANAVLNKRVVEYLKAFANNKIAICFTLVFFLYLLGGIYSQDINGWTERVRIKLPFLVLPFAFTSLFPLPKKLFHQLLITTIGCVTIGCLYSITNYIQNYDEINTAYVFAKTLKTPIDHIRFSLMVAISIMLCLYFIMQFSGNNKSKIIWVAICIFLTTYLHILAVRTGLLAFYLSLIYFSAYLIYFHKKTKAALFILILGIALPFAAYMISPTFKTKVNYMQYDIKEYISNKNVAGKSDANRLLSQELSWQIIQQHPIFGVGIGDVNQEMNNSYKINHPEIPESAYLAPHNQFLYVWMGCGMVGLITFLLPLFLIIKNNYSSANFLFFATTIITVSSFFTEPVLEIQIGTAIFIFFILLFHHQFNKLVYEN